jgi:hypothetical protein
MLFHINGEMQTRQQGGGFIQCNLLSAPSLTYLQELPAGCGGVDSCHLTQHVPGALGLTGCRVGNHGVSCSSAQASIGCRHSQHLDPAHHISIYSC